MSANQVSSAKKSSTNPLRQGDLSSQNGSTVARSGASPVTLLSLKMIGVVPSRHILPQDCTLPAAVRRIDLSSYREKVSDLLGRTDCLAADESEL